MERYNPQNNPQSNIPEKIISLGLILLLSTVFFGVMGAIEYAIPGIFRNFFSFEKIRPLHVSSAVFWILFTAAGCVLYFLREHNQKPLKKNRLAYIFYYTLGVTIIGILISYCFGLFGGREYWEFNPVFALPITAGWIFFIIIILSNIQTLKNQPVYIWMWLTGVLFFLFTYLESNVWILPNFGNYLIKDMLIQWKSYGSLVGSWNLLIYGSSIFLMDKISGNTKYSHSATAFWIYFLGLFNLMFNWGHHVYTLPTAPYVQYIAYAVSMTELILFARIIYQWKLSLDTIRKFRHLETYRFLMAADFWVFMTLLLAIPMSIPAVNVYFHGTHVIVAHTMGATIGINTMLLLSFVSYITKTNQNAKRVRLGYRLTNYSLIFFWIVLIVVGVIKGKMQIDHPDFVYRELMQQLHPYFVLFLITGTLIAIGLSILVISFLNRLSFLKRREFSSNKEKEKR